MNCTGGTEREYFLEAWIAARRWKESNFWKRALPQGGWKESNFWRHGLLRRDGKRVLFGGMHCNEEMEREPFFWKHPLLWGDGKRVIFGMHGLHWSAKTSKDIILDCTFFFGCKNRLHTKKNY